MKLAESFISSFDYKSPKTAEEDLYDFYFMVGYLYGTKIDREDEQWAINHALDTCVNSLAIKMQRSLKYCLAAEFKHITDYCNLLREIKSAKQAEKDERAYAVKALNAKLGHTTAKFLIKYLELFPIYYASEARTDIGNASEFYSMFSDRYETSDRHYRGPLNTKKYGTSNYDLQYNLLIATQKALKYTNEQIAECFIRIFSDENGWHGQYGGEAWQRIAKCYQRLLEVKDIGDKIVYIDHAYDLQHNTGSVFTKLKYYAKGSSYYWIKEALDWKRDCTDIHDYYEKVSTQLKPIVSWLAYKSTGKAMLPPEDPKDIEKELKSHPLNQYLIDKDYPFISSVLRTIHRSDKILGASKRLTSFDQLTTGVVFYLPGGLIAVVESGRPGVDIINLRASSGYSTALRSIYIDKNMETSYSGYYIVPDAIVSKTIKDVENKLKSDSASSSQSVESPKESNIATDSFIPISNPSIEDVKDGITEGKITPLRDEDIIAGAQIINFKDKEAQVGVIINEFYNESASPLGQKYYRIYYPFKPASAIDTDSIEFKDKFPGEDENIDAYMLYKKSPLSAFDHTLYHSVIFNYPKKGKPVIIVKKNGVITKNDYEIFMKIDSVIFYRNVDNNRTLLLQITNIVNNNYYMKVLYDDVEGTVRSSVWSIDRVMEEVNKSQLSYVQSAYVEGKLFYDNFKFIEAGSSPSDEATDTAQSKAAFDTSLTPIKAAKLKAGDTIRAGVIVKIIYTTNNSGTIYYSSTESLDNIKKKRFNNDTVFNHSSIPRHAVNSFEAFEIGQNVATYSQNSKNSFLGKITGKQKDSITVNWYDKDTEVSYSWDTILNFIKNNTMLWYILDWNVFDTNTKSKDTAEEIKPKPIDTSFTQTKASELKAGDKVIGGIIVRISKQTEADFGSIYYTPTGYSYNIKIIKFNDDTIFSHYSLPRHAVKNFEDFELGQDIVFTNLKNSFLGKIVSKLEDSITVKWYESLSEVTYTWHSIFKYLKTDQTSWDILDENAFNTDVKPENSDKPAEPAASDSGDTSTSSVISCRGSDLEVGDKTSLGTIIRIDNDTSYQRKILYQPNDLSKEQATETINNNTILVCTTIPRSRLGSINDLQVGKEVALTNEKSSFLGRVAYKQQSSVTILWFDSTIAYSSFDQDDIQKAIDDGIDWKVLKANAFEPDYKNTNIPNSEKDKKSDLYKSASDPFIVGQIVVNTVTDQIGKVSFVSPDKITVNFGSGEPANYLIFFVPKVYNTLRLATPEEVDTYNKSHVASIEQAYGMVNKHTVEIGKQVKYLGLPSTYSITAITPMGIKIKSTRPKATAVHSIDFDTPAMSKLSFV